MAPTRLAGLILVGIGTSALLVPWPIVAALVLAVLVAGAVDAWLARTRPTFARALPDVVSRAVPVPLRIIPDRSTTRVDVRQPAPPDVTVTPAEQRGGLEALFVATRRGRHLMPPYAVRSVGPLRLGQVIAREGHDHEICVFPDMVAARRLASQVQQGRFALDGRRRRGPIGLGTEFESIRTYVPGDDIRQVNWAATARSGAPMVSQWRMEQDRDVLCVLDAGRLMAAPVGDRTRMDAAVDAAAAVAAVADVVGDRAGVVAFRDVVIRDLPPGHRNGQAVAEAIFDVEPEPVEPNYLLAFQHAADRKRALIVVLTDFVDPAASRPLQDAVPVLTRRHSVIVAGARDPALDEALSASVTTIEDAARAAVALDVAADRRQVVAGLRHHGAQVVEVGVEDLGARVVAAYLRAKALARF